MAKVKTPIIFLLSFLCCGIFQKTHAQEWQLKKYESGIAIYTRNAENSNFKELKAVFQIKTSLSSIIALLNDVASYPEWIYKCEKAKLLKKDSDMHLIRYQSIVTPWPVSRRDVIGDVNSYQDNKTKIVYQKVKALPDYIPQENDHVRIHLFRASWALKPLKNGIVEVEYELLVDPAGTIPIWIINLAIVDGPFETAFNLKKMVMKEKYQKAIIPFIVNPE